MHLKHHFGNYVVQSKQEYKKKYLDVLNCLKSLFQNKEFCFCKFTPILHYCFNFYLKKFELLCASDKFREKILSNVYLGSMRIEEFVAICSFLSQNVQEYQNLSRDIELLQKSIFMIFLDHLIDSLQLDSEKITRENVQEAANRFFKPNIDHSFKLEFTFESSTVEFSKTFGFYNGKIDLSFLFPESNTSQET